MRTRWAIYRESDKRMVEGGFFSKARAEEHCEREYNEPARRDDPSGMEHYYVAKQG